MSSKKRLGEVLIRKLKGGKVRRTMRDDPSEAVVATSRQLSALEEVKA